MRHMKWFKVNGEDREFMYYFGSKDLSEIHECKEQIKNQNDLYRITQTVNGYLHIWDARK